MRVRVALLCAVLGFVWLMAFATARGEVPAPGEAVSIDLLRKWQVSGWGHDPEAIRQAKSTPMDLSGPPARFTTAEPSSRGVWNYYLHIPVRVEDYPIAVLTYRGRGLAVTGDRFAFSAADAYPCATEDMGRPVFELDQLVADGEVHELRADLRELNVGEKVTCFAVAVESTTAGEAELELIDLRFERPAGAEALAVERGRPISVTLVDEQDRPLEGATVTVDAERRNGAVTATTDAAGQATLAPWSNPAGKHMLRIEAEGRVPVEWAEAQRGADRPLRIAVPEAARYSGIVRDESGQPIAGARVEILIPQNGPRPADLRLTTRADAVSDAEGRWKSPPMPLADVAPWLKFSHADYASDAMFGATLQASLQDVLDGTAVAVLKRGLSLTGVVRDAGGEPVAGARVKQGRDRWGSDYPATVTDAEGRFAFANVRPGEVVLTVEAKGHAPLLRAVNLRASEQVELALEPARTIRGQVVDAEGKPIRGATVIADTWRGARSIEFRVGTDDEGRFAWTDAPADDVQFHVLKEGKTDIRDLLLRASDDEHRIELRQQTIVRGTVVDAETGEPVPAFRIVRGIHFGEDRPVHWQRSDRPITGDGGTFEFPVTYPYPGHLVRVEADGYVPADSRIFRSDEGEVRLEFRLKHGEPTAGVVHAPDGSPAADAEVALATAQGLQIENGRIAEHARRDAVVTRTGGDGRFSLPPQVDGFLLIVLHDAGYAQLTKEEAEGASEIKLQPWARVEGTLRVGAGPGAGERVMGWIHDEAPYMPNRPRVFHSLSASADGEGRFVLDRVPAGRVAVGRQVKTSETSWTSSHSVPLTLEAGATREVTIGGTGRPVVGRIQLPEVVRQADAWTWGFTTIQAKVDRPTFEPPDEVQAMTPEERQAWFEAWKQTEGGKAYVAAEKAANEAHRSYAVLIDKEGNLRAEDIPAGTYTLQARAHVVPPGQQCGWGEELASLTHTFTVDPIPGGRSDEPLELPSLAMEPVVRLEVGDAAPAFETVTLDGEPLKLADLRGKYVLLDFWATWCGPCVAETPNLKAVYEAHGKDPRFAMVALSLDAKPEAPRKYAQKNGLGWTQGFLGDWSEAKVPGLYGVRGIPSIWLIGPDGKVVVKNLRGEGIKQAVDAALAESR